MTLIQILASSAALAQQTGDDGAYSQVLAEAVAEYQRGNWAEARSLFTRVHRMKPSARSLRGLAMASFEGRWYVEAVLAARESLDHPNQPLSKQQRVEMQQLIERAQSFVGRFELTLEPSVAIVQVDGKDAVLENGRLLLNPGMREIVARADGYKTASRRVAVEGGGSGRLELVLEPEVAQAPEPAPTDVGGEVIGPEPGPSASSKADAGGSDLAPWLVIGASGAVAIAGGVLLGIALNDKATVENAERGARLQELQDAHDRVPLFSTLGAVLLGVGITGAAVGVILLSTGDTQDEQVSLRVAPNGISIRGSL